MSIAATAVEKRAVTYFGTILVVLAGIASYFSLGQLEDPDFTVKTAVVATPYPGASPTEVELEVTDRLELAIQQLKPLKNVRSKSTAGMSVIWVDIKTDVNSADLPQVWDELRRKVRDTEPRLPPGAGPSFVNDDFGDVFGHVVALVSDGFSYAELEEYAKLVKKEITLIDGVSKVEFWGDQDEAIYIDISESLTSQLGIGDQTLQLTLQNQNVVNDAGSVDVQDQRLRFDPTGQFTSTEDIANLIVRASALDSAQSSTPNKSDELIRIRDIAEVNRGYKEPAQNIMRFNGQTAIALSISNVPGVNVVDMGRAVSERLRELEADLPIGIEMQRVHWQSDVISEAVNGFLVSFAEAVAIVIVVLTIGMGLRMSLIIGAALVVTILGTFILMSIFGIDLQRMSLGALIIALGMMVDNAIVVADGFVVRLEQGMDRKKAAIEAAALPSIPLLGATIVAVMAFYPIAASTENAGEYCASLFSVVAISLMVSWIVSITVTPLQCMDLLPDPKGGGAADPYDTPMFRSFKGLLAMAIRRRWITIGGTIALLVISVLGFGQVKKLFFPDSAMTKFMVDYWGPEGTRVGVTDMNMKRIEQRLLEDERVEGVATFVGGGPPRFYLPVEPEPTNQSYGQFIVNVGDIKDIEGVINDIAPWLREEFPDAQIPLRKFGVGPSNTWKFDVRISGPAVADPDVLRETAAQVTSIIRDAPLAGDHTTDWRQRTKVIVPDYNEQRGRWTGVTRANIASATKRAFDGRAVGLYRESDELIPIILRNNEQDRQSVGGLPALQVKPGVSNQMIPLGQVTDEIRLDWEDPIVKRRDRRRTIAVQANPIAGVTLPALRTSVVDEVESISLPEGYVMEWGGEYESSRDSQASLVPGVIPAFVIISFIIVALFNAFRPPLVIALSIPFAMIGITAGLLSTGAAFGFVALLGAMSLVGMMIKNAVVLLDQADIFIAEGQSHYDAIVNATISRARPVALAAGTTVLGVIPLLQDVFWVGLAVTVMAGLTFGTVLTLILVPVLYAALFRLKANAT
ncbi:MAG: efflux RND transporter permease subunit [Gammaproteobacteria bacterium]